MTPTYRSVAIAVLCTILLSSCLHEFKSVFYGRQMIKLPSGKEVYVKTMVWGITSDHYITTLSETSDLYDLRNAKSDYVFPGYVPRLYYRAEGNTLILYDFEAYGAPDPPENGQFPVSVRQVNLHIMEYYEMEDHPEKFGVTRLAVTIDTNL